MYERILNKQETPSIEDMTAYCGGTAEWFTLLNEWLSNTYETAEKIVFPYGNNYGWGIAHRVRSKLICNIFPEDGAFTVMIRLSDNSFHLYMNRCRNIQRGILIISIPAVTEAGYSTVSPAGNILMILRKYWT